MPLYKCEFCKFQTEKKTDFQRHKDRKVPCTLSQLAKRESELESKIEKIVEERLAMATQAPTAIESEIKAVIAQTSVLTIQPQQIDVNVLVNLNKKLHNIFRNQLGDVLAASAHYNISRMLFYAFAQNYYKTRLADLVDPKFYVNLDGYEPCWMNLLNITEILQSEDAVVDGNLQILWKKMLAYHPITEKIFPQSSFFIGPAKIIKLCLFEIYKVTKEIDFDHLNEDARGKIYEYYINEYNGNGGKELGQFFTPRSLIKSAFHLLKTNLGSYDFKPNFIYDPCMGTAGFLTEAYREFKDSVDNGGVYGSEIEPETYISGYMNLILSIKPPILAYKQDSLRDNANIMFNLIVTNPPFGMKPNYDNLINDCNESALKDPSKVRGEILYPVKTNNGAALFLQHCMAKLAPGGICCIVLPNGELLTKGGAFATIRQNLMSKFYIIAIMKVPEGAFKNAGVGTIILVFANMGYLAQSIKFYDCAKSGEVSTIKFLEEIPVGKIVDKKYSWHYGHYRTIESLETGYPIEKLGNICEIKSGKTITVAEFKDGIYPVLGGGKDIMGYHNEYNIDSGVIIIARKGAAGYISITKNKSYMSDGVFALINIKEDIKDKYLYYYLEAIQELIYELAKGAGVPMVNKTDLSQIDIPIPPMEKQEEIVLFCENIDQRRGNYKNDSLLLLANTSKKFACEKLFRKYPYESKTMNDVCVDFIKGKHSSTQTVTNETGESKFITVAFEEKWKNTDIVDCSGESLMISNVSSGKLWPIHYYNGKMAYCNLLYKITHTSNIKTQYMYYYLKEMVQEWLSENCLKGAANKSLDLIVFKNIPIPVPSLEDQQRIIEEYDTDIMGNYNMYMGMIEENNKQIEFLNEQQRKSFM